MHNLYIIGERPNSKASNLICPMRQFANLNDTSRLCRRKETKKIVRCVYDVRLRNVRVQHDYRQGCASI